MVSITPDPTQYDSQLVTKQQVLLEQFGDFAIPALEVFPSPPLHYRQRAEFKIWQQGSRAHYAMFPDGPGSSPQFITAFPVAAKSICQLMPVLLEAINDNLELRRKLFQIEFLSTLSGQTLVTMVYHRHLAEPWVQCARALEQRLKIFVVGRSRKQKLVLSQDTVREVLPLADGDTLRHFSYQQMEGCFTQPNADICISMLNWVSSVAATEDNQDLLELYCGNGNFSLPLSRYFRRVLATEISKPLIQLAQRNCRDNLVDNIDFVRLSAAELTAALRGVRPFRRLRDINLETLDFTSVLVDPPRAGLDVATCELIQQFNSIFYISCNPTTLAPNLQLLTRTHAIARLALFDQFPYTQHMECGVFLRKR